ncbi:hypothetical protein TVAG_213560 [Trichomonas vaginalis G3]|uniref:Helicase ATP-binding domain-containing protein n=1 Tax=Trichomonas vaginalis (strain ATCC PRA-98 / G3) TaxID=412133 RepID=A2EYT8_TRIV3|nr:P-loop containing nucleoside triphosphate hydrolases family [Trichomonas vaginalis G3]EAY02157.1 hypothetical protein TVAG_213560 [Trichomonas vaginalis G3]KAI5554254.1 P-loop containing nucleoside triphosphate hydrolases family [Trichomonas vaginalis G3]|eukprot:XP_001330560.1 hypothetical protein [Trichomonas vaginalis G3]
MSSDIVDISSIIGKEISVVKDPDIACTTLSIDQTIRLDGIPTPIKNQILCIKRCLDYLNLTNEMEHLDQLLLELEMSEIKDLTTFTDPCQLIKSLNTDNSFIVIDGFQESCDAYLVRGTENGEITWWVLLNSMTCNNEYIAIDSYAIDYSRLNEFDSFKHGTIACSFLINENKIFEREEHKHPIRKIQSSNVIESLEELYLEYEGKITKVNNFDALCSNSSRDDSYTVFYFKDNTCVGISTIEGFTKVYSTEPFFEFNGISLYIVKDGQKTIRNSTINKQKKVAKEAQRSIDEFCLNYTETVAKSILRDYESQISGISNNFNTPESIMKFITNMLYNKDPNETQKAFASSTVFRPSDINDPIKHRVFFLSTPPGSGKTACEIMPAVYENFKQSFKSDSEQSITIIATSLVQVSGQISSACFSLYGGNDKWLKVRRLDGGSKELLGGKQQNTIFFKPKFAKEHVLDSEAIRKRILKGFSTETLKEYMEAVFKEAKLNIDGNIFDQVLKNFTDPNSFRKNTIPFIYEGIDSKGRFNADVLVGTYEMIYSTLINTLVGNEKVDNKSAEQIANRIKYIIIDEWDTIFRPKIADKNPISEVLDQRFSHSYGIIALALLLLKKNPNCKLILASGTGSKMLKICEENILTGKSSNMLEPLLRCIPTKKELDDALKVIENESNNQLSKEKQVMFVKKSNTSSLDNAKSCWNV